MYGHRLLRELIGLLFLFCGLLMLLSLWSYSPLDPSFNQAVTIQSKSSIHNAAGMFGAYLAGSMVDIFGVTSFLWIIFFLAVGSGLVSHWLVLKWYRWIGYLLLFFCVLTLSARCDLGLHGIHGGGLAGDTLVAFSHVILSPIGSLLLWIFAFLVAMELSFSVPWLSIAGALLAWTGSRLFSKTDREAGSEVPDADGQPAVPQARPAARLRRLFKRRSAPEDVPPEPRGPLLDIMLPEDPGDAPSPVPDQDDAESHAGVTPGESGQDDPVFTLTLMPEDQDDAPDGQVRPPLEGGGFPEHAAGGQRAESPAEDLPRPEDAEAPAGRHPLVPVPSGPPSREGSSQAPSDASGPAEPAAAQDANPAYASLEKILVETMALQDQQREQDAGETPGKPVPPAAAPAPVLPRRRQYDMPTPALLDTPPTEAVRPDIAKIRQQGMAIIECLKEFRVDATFANYQAGPVVTMFELRPGPGVKATRITNLANDLTRSLKAPGPVRMQAPVLGTDTVGVEVPNEQRQTVYFRDIVENDAFRNAKSLLTIALGKNIGGVPFSADLAKMPHLLVAGATGKGKSVCLNAILLSLLCRARPDEVQLILIDPKRVEFSMYADLPHLVHPVVTDMDITKNALLWAIDEMNRRLELFSTVMERNISGYNKRQARLREEAIRTGRAPVDPATGEPLDLADLPYIVIVVDELADLMQTKRKEVEGPIARLAQLARAAGIHLIIATQRPSVDVVTGLIKANFPCRIAFQVTNGQDSRTILDCVGAEKLLGNGDMLYKPTGDGVQRLHGAFVSDREVAAMVSFWKRQQAPNYKVDFSQYGSEDQGDAAGEYAGQHRNNDLMDDPLYAESVEYVLSVDKVSISGLQRRFRIGFNKAALFVEQMEQDGIIVSDPVTKQKRVVHDR